MTTLVATLGDKGRLVVPAEIRRSHDWRPGSALVFIDTPDGVRLQSAEDALSEFRLSVAGTASPVDELLAERRREAMSER